LFSVPCRPIANRAHISSSFLNPLPSVSMFFQYIFFSNTPNHLSQCIPYVIIICNSLFILFLYFMSRNSALFELFLFMCTHIRNAYRKNADQILNIVHEAFIQRNCSLLKQFPSQITIFIAENAIACICLSQQKEGTIKGSFWKSENQKRG
jgi:hypothetical protein